MLICVDDCCPEKSGDHILKNITSKKVVVIKHQKNMGVGGALKTGFKLCLKLKPNVIVKLDGDNQIDPDEAHKISQFLKKSSYDYVVGSRFKKKANKKSVPKLRWYGNKLISLISKVSTGLYHIDDFLNGLIAIKLEKLKLLNIDNMKNDFLFETDMLVKISNSNLKVCSFPMRVKYFKNNSNFQPAKEFKKFMLYNLKKFISRIFKNYFLKNISLHSLAIILFLLFGYLWLKQLIFMNSIFNLDFLLSIYFLIFFFILDLSEKKGQ
tara:strand:- start:134 stop:934 length:801 start_codon:yes stop_codon:yes gene_type:complete